MDGNAQQRPSEPGRPLTIRAIVISGVLMGVAGAAAASALLYFYGGGTPHDQAGLDAVRTAGTLVVGAGGAIALLLAARRQRSTELTLEHQHRTLEHQREVAATAARDAVEQRITELYTRAVDQLGNDQAPVRLGGLHALERLAQNNPTQRQTIVDVICAYLRMPYTPPDDKSPSEDALTDTRTRYEQQRQELQVRLTAQRILAAHLRPTAVGTYWPDIDLDLTEAQLHTLDLSGCHIRNAQFGGARFSGNAKFTRALFSGNVEFGGARFSGDPRFDMARFSGIASFVDAQFFDEASFEGAQFSYIECAGARFSGNVTFRNTQFLGTARFDGAQFSRYAGFNWAQFSSYAGFADAQFSGSAGFIDAQFSESAAFRGAQFSESASFSGAQFSGGAGFREARFSGDAGFAGAKFSHAEFGNAQFSGETDFFKAQFSGDVWFNHVHFSEKAEFIGAQFSGDAWFVGAQFSRGSEFGGARVRPANSKDRFWPAGWTAREVREGQEEGWLFLVHIED